MTSHLDSTVYVVDGATNTVIDTIVAAAPTGIAVNPSGTQIYVASDGAQTVTVIDTATHAITATFPWGDSGVAINRTGTRAYSTFGSSPGRVQVIDAVNQKQIGFIEVRNVAFGIAVHPNGTLAYVTNNASNSVSVIDTVQNKVIGSIRVGLSPAGIAVSSAGDRAYVANFADNTVSVINLASNVVIDNITVETAPVWIALTPHGTSAYVANYGSNTVSVIDTASDSVIDSIAVGTNPTSVGITPGLGPPTSKEQCKNGGWQLFTFPREFKNQGDCISYVNHSN